MGDITQNFSQWEFACKCKCGYDNIDERLVNRLQVIRDMAGIPIKINSGCRCEKHNKKVGGAPNSYHLQGLAADWRFDVKTQSMLHIFAIRLKDWSGGFHYYENDGFIHTDIGIYRRW